MRPNIYEALAMSKGLRREVSNEYCCNMDTALDPLHNNAQYVDNPTGMCAGRETISTANPAGGNQDDYDEGPCSLCGLVAR
jgi:hypothetical protein